MAEVGPDEAQAHGTSGSARAEAERLVAAALAAVRLAASGTDRFATGSAECCVCPVCRAMTVARDPSPELAERLAAGAGELAAGVAALLRSFADPAAPGSAAEPGEPPDPGAARETGDAAGPPRQRDVWAAATHADEVSEDGPGDGEELRR